MTGSHIAMSVSDLQRASLVVLGVDPCSEGELCDEDLSCLGKQDRSLSTDHLHRERWSYTWLNTPTDYQTSITYPLQRESLGMRVTNGCITFTGAAK